MMRMRALAALAICIGFAEGPAQAVEITHVSAEPRVVASASDGPISVLFRLSEPAKVSLDLFDGRDLLIRRIRSQDTLGPGDRRLTWDLRDQVGRVVPPEAYRYTLTAVTANGERVEHDLTDLTAGEDLIATDVAWDPDDGFIRYRLPSPGRVNIRVGLAHGGPLLATVLDWVARDAGFHREPWDGFDASGVLDLTRHPDLKIVIDAFGLSANTLLVGPPADQVTLITDLPWGEERRTVKRTERKRMHFHRQQPIESRGDYQIELTLPSALPRDTDGIPIVNGMVPIRLDISDRDRDRALARRFEPVFFVDGIFAFENEVGFLPMTWRWDSSGANAGIHYLTANLRGYEGNFGVATLKVRVPRQPELPDAGPADASRGLAQ